MILVTDGQMRHSLVVVRSLGRKGLKVMVGDSEMISTSFFFKIRLQKNSLSRSG